MKQLLSEEFRRMQKLAGITESVIIKETPLNNPETITLPFNIYYINGSSETRNIGLDDGIITEPELMAILWSEYQNTQDFERSTKSGGDKYTNTMQDIGFNTDFDVDADKMFFGEIIQNLLDNIELYIPKGTEGTKEKEFKDSYNEFTYGIYWSEDGSDFKYSKQEADKYQYMLIDDDEFKDFVSTLKPALN
jgi:hypothetical protein